MSVTTVVGHPTAQLSSPNEADHRRQIAQVANRAMQGIVNTNLIITLDPGATQTVITDSRISAQKFIGLMPQTANAAAALASGSVFVSCTKGSATISHPSSAATDRTFTACMMG